MKNKKITIIVIITLLIALITTIVLICIKPNKNENPPDVPPSIEDPTLPSQPCNPNEQLKTYKQNLNYTESIEKIDNPDQGFYRPIYVKVTESDTTFNKNIITKDTQLYHLRVDISQFSSKVNNSEDKLLTTEALNGIEELLNHLKQNNKNAIIRFSYDPNFGGKANTEPNPTIIYEHIKQVSGILNKFYNTLTAIEAGLIGPWGEMHTSVIANATYISPIIETFLANTNRIPVLVRTPKMIYDYLGITINEIDNYTIDKNSKAYYLGLYNDGYLGSSTDLETYTNRLKEIEFLSKQTNHLPFGGEVVVPNSTLHNIDVCLPEMNKINLNYLNIEWNNEVIDKWKNSHYTNMCGNDETYYNQTAFTYIENHMGYRYVLTNSVFEYSNKFDKINIALSFNNVGFGNLNKQKQSKLIFVNENNEIKFTKQLDNFMQTNNVSYSTPLNLENGKYKVYLSLYGEELNNNLLYAIKFANSNLWNTALQANLIGEININK